MGADRRYDPAHRLQTKDGICEYLGGISHATYDTWHNRGLVPGPVEVLMQAFLSGWRPEIADSTADTVVHNSGGKHASA